MKILKAAVISIFIIFFNIDGICHSFSNPLHNDFFSKMDSLERKSLHDEAAVELGKFIEDRLAMDSVNHKVLTRAYQRKGNCFRVTGLNPKSIQLFEEAINHAFLANDSIEAANAYNEMGYSFTIMGRYEEALEYYSKALEIDEKLESWIGVAMDLNAIGKIYELWKQYEKALEFLYQSLEIAREQNNQNMVALRMASIGSVYKSMAEYQIALEWLNKSLELEKKLNNEIRSGYRLDQIGEVYTLMNNFDLAETYLKQALTVFRENNIAISESITLNHLGYNSLKKGETQVARNYYNESLSIAMEVGFNNMLQKNHREISMLHEQVGNYQFALEHYKEYITLKDTAFSDKARQELMYFQVKYKTEQKEKELALLNQEKLERELELNKSNQQRILMGGVSVILLVLLGALYSRFYIKKRAQFQLTAVNNQLNEINQTKDKFFNILAHDLKNPIYAFRNISTAVHDSYNDLKPEEVNNFTLELKSSSTKLCSFLDELLKWAASQTGHLNPQKQSFKIKPLFDELKDLHNTMIENKSIIVSINIEDRHFAFADRNMIHTVFRNILANAVKFTPENGWVKIDSVMNEKEVLIKVADSGIGISDEDIKKLFDIGHDASKIGNSDEKGSGLGLILCKEFLERNNGNISVESKLGKGTVFMVTLPAE